MPDEVSNADKIKSQLKAFVHNPNTDEVVQIDKESEKALAKVKKKAINFEIDTLAEFEQKKTKKTGTRRITVDLPEENHFHFKMLAHELGTDMNALLNRVVEKMIANRIDK